MTITVREALRRLQKMNPDAVFVIEGSDHSYRLADMQETTALRDEETGTFTQDFGEQDTPEAEYGKRVPIVNIY